MVIRRIEVWNFLSHEHEQVTFEEHGIVHLSGNSGFGKSSLIVDAPAYALFGARATRAKKQENLKNRKFASEAMRVSVTFQFENDQWLTIERGLSEKNKPEALIYEPDPDNPGHSRVVEETPAKVQKYINRRLGGMNWLQFYSAFVTKQDQIRGLIELTGKERANRIHGMMGVHEIKKGEDIVDSDLIKIRNHFQMQQAKTEGRTFESENKKLLQAQTNKNERIAELEKAKSLLGSLKEELAVSAKEWEELEPLYNNHNFLSSQKEQLKEKEDNLLFLEKEKNKQAEMSILISQEKEIVSLLEKQKEEIEFLRGQAAYAKEQNSLLERIEKEKSKLSPVIVDVSSNYLQTEKQLKENNIIVLEKEKNKIEEDLHLIAETDSCPTCLRGFSHDEHDVKEKIESKLSEINFEIEQIKKEIIVIEKQIPDVLILEKNKKVQEDIQKNIVLLEENLKEKNFIDVDQIIVQGKKLSDDLAETQKKFNLLENAKKFFDKEIEEKFFKTEKEIVSLKENIKQAENSISHDNLQEKKDSIELLKQRVAKGEGLISAMEHNVLLAEKEEKVVLKEIEMFFEELEAMEKISRQKNHLLLIREFLQSFQRQLVSDIRPALEEIASEMLQQVSSGVHSNLKIVSDTYDIEVQTDEDLWLPASELSGGEQTRVAICVRLALTHLVATRVGVPVQFLVFDEPLPAQDEGHIEQIMELLHALSKHWKQVFIISHVGNLASSEYVDYVLDFSKRTGRSRVQLFKA